MRNSMKSMGQCDPQLLDLIIFYYMKASQQLFGLISRPEGQMRGFFVSSALTLLNLLKTWRCPGMDR